MILFNKIDTNEKLKTFTKLADAIWHEYFPFLLSSEQINYMVKKFQSYEVVKSQIACGYNYYFIEKGSEICGYTGFCTKEDYLFLSKLYIKKEYRNSGLGRAALQFLSGIARKQGLKKIILTVNKYNDSTISAYKNWGFSIIDSVVTDIGNGFVMDDYIMEYVMPFEIEN